MRHPPHLDDRVFLTDGGLETTLIYDRGLDLPEFAAFPLLGTEAGREALTTYYATYLELAQAHGTGFVLESPTWRASRDWGTLLGYDAAALDDVNRRAIALMAELREQWGGPDLPIVISGNIGPQGDAYDPEAPLSASAAEAYHAPQLATFADTDADLATALTLTHAEEAIGLARAARAAGIPVVLSFTVETDGRLPSGQPLGQAIAQVDAETDGSAAAFGVNCAHPTHFRAVLDAGAPWAQRVGLVRANASTRSHAELDVATELDAGDPDELGAQHAALAACLPRVRVLGGCCGTDHRHVGAIAGAWPRRT